MNAATISKTDYSKNNRPLSKTSLIQWHHKNVPGSNEEKLEINCFYFYFCSGRSEKSQSVVDSEVVTTEVCPRSRPEGRKLDSVLSLPPPPLQDKR